MPAERNTPTRREALRILERGRSETLALVGSLPRSSLATPGLGGGEWSPKDLIGHLASWEEYALDALAAWDRGERAPIDALQFTVSTSRLNSQNVEAKAAWSFARVKRDSDRNRVELLAAIEGLSEARWRHPATARGRVPLGRRLGSILWGPSGPFSHDVSHHASLRAFVRDCGSGAGRP